MLYITNYQKTSTESLIPLGYANIEKDTTGKFELTVNANEKDNPYSFGLIQEESVITANGLDFRIKQMQRKSKGNVKSVLAQHIFFDNVWRRQDGINGGTKDLNQFASFALQGTGWTFTSDVVGTAAIPEFGRDNVVKLVQLICSSFECEFEITSNSSIHFSRQIGPDNDFVYRYGDNIVALSETVNTDNLRTVVEGTGKDDLKVTYTSVEGVSRWGVRKGEPISDERFTDREELLTKVRESITDYPEVTIELDSIDLFDRKLGERVWLIHEPMNFELQSRILKITSVVDIVTGELKTYSVVIGNTLNKSLSDIIIETEQNVTDAVKEYRSSFTINDNNIRLEVEKLNESIGVIDLKADSIELSVNNRITNEVSSINLRADGIQLQVNNNDAEIARVDIKANQIQSTVSQQSGQLAGQQSQITQNANQISQKVSQTDYNGNTINSLINQTATTVTIQASKIQLRGAVSVLSDITGDLGTITTGNINIQQDIYLGNRLFLRGSGGNRIDFSEGSNIVAYNGNTDIATNNNLNIQAQSTNFYGSSVDFSNVGSIYGVARGHTPGIGIAYSASSNFLYVRINGSNVGYVKLN